MLDTIGSDPSIEMLHFAQTAASPTGGILSTVLMFGAMFAVLYFILIRPQQKQQQKHQALITGLKKGDEVILSSGIIGKIYAIEDNIVTLEIGEKMRLRVLKQAVQALVNNPPQQENVTPTK